jgi:hypothetical protein
MVLLTSAGFLALHALATPGVVLSGPGHITIGGRTLDEANAEPDVIVDVKPLGPTDLKGKTELTDAFELLSVSAPRGG